MLGSLEVDGPQTNDHLTRNHPGTLLIGSEAEGFTA